MPGPHRPDNDANERIYHKKFQAEDIVFKGAVAVPPSAQELTPYLNKKSPKNTSDPSSLQEFPNERDKSHARDLLVAYDRKESIKIAPGSI
jgi:hypothetical protein